ncbi:MFS transporter [Natronorubrum sp. JWXQ-INN-674]|uniref:MFS transporter n=1 Tax=Natronorubrum halalkaliphilum TaxID=2691917 RepID=A0A6B0VNG9_9EURY|nr:MFS transporter [Natronorubrum halalkaliphilum]MXV63008.1 MFS transporter [Natronorubrum halalkaliphilum]
MKSQWTQFGRDSDGAFRILIVIAACWFFAQGLRLSFPVLLPHISLEYGLDIATGGLLISLLFGAYAIGQFPGGVLGDWVGERNVLAASMTLVVFGTVLVFGFERLEAVVVGIGLLGFGCGMFAPARFTILSDVFEERDGVAHGVTMAVGDVGNTILPVLAGFLAVAIAWRYGVGYAVPILLLLVIALWVTIPERTSAPPESAVLSRTMLRDVGRSLSRPEVAAIFIVLLVQSFIFQGHTGLYPTYLVTEKGFSEEHASVLLGLFFGSAAVMNLIAGVAADRFGKVMVIGILSVVGTAAFGLLPVVTSLPTVIIVTVFTSAPIGVVTVALPYLIETLPENMRGTGFGILRTTYIALTAVSPFIIGSLGNIGHFDVGIWLFGAATALSFVVSRTLSSP